MNPRIFGRLPCHGSGQTKKLAGAGGFSFCSMPCVYRNKVQKNMGQPAVDAGTSHWSSWVPEVEVEPARWVIGRPSELEADSQPSLNIGSDGVARSGQPRHKIRV